MHHYVMLNLYKKLFPESRIFLGGFMAAAYWREFLKASVAIDGVILGEGEKIFRRIIEKNLKSIDDSLHDVKGVALDEKSQLVHATATAQQIRAQAPEHTKKIRQGRPPVAWPCHENPGVFTGHCISIEVTIAAEGGRLFQ